MVIFMERKVLLFDSLLEAACKAAEKIKAGQIAAGERSVKECENRCKELGIFTEISEDADEKAGRDARENVRKGKWFASRSFRQVIKHMLLLQEIEGDVYELELGILETLHAHIGNAIYYEAVVIDRLMEAAAVLYQTSLNTRGGRVYNPRLMEEHILLIDAVKELKRKGITIKISQGEPEFEGDSEKKVALKLNEMVRQVGGEYMIRRLFQYEIAPRYNKKIGRYLICRDKKTIIANGNQKRRIPYQYLLQISLKHLTEEGAILQNKQKMYEKIVRLAGAYMEALQLQGYYSMEDMFRPLEDFPIILSKNLCFEKLYIPRQYHPEYVKMLLRHMLKPFYPQGKSKPRVYSFHNYFETAVYIMENAMGPRIFEVAELRDALGISDYKLQEILKDISGDVKIINKDFEHYLDPTDSWKKPLVRLEDDRYFCMDGRMAGYAFYEVMYQILFSVYGSVFSKRQGENLENMVYKMFQEKRFPFLSGRYPAFGDMPERDCDMILEGETYDIFLEIKKCPLPVGYEEADDVEVLRALGEGMLYAQEQILWHKLMLKKKGALNLYDKNGDYLSDFTPGNKKIISVSICMPEYDFLTDRGITESFLESTLLVSYHAADTERETLLKKLNMRAGRIQEVAAKLFEGRSFDVREVFFDSQFRSLQQIWTMLKFCDNVDEFMDLCVSMLLVITGAGDVYAEVLQYLHMRKFKRENDG